MIYAILNENLTEANKEYISFDSETTNVVISALNNAFIEGTGRIATNYYANNFDPKIVSAITFGLSKLGYIESVVKSKWAEIAVNSKKIAEFRTATEIHNYRMAKRVADNAMKLNRDLPEADIVKCGREYRKTGLIRKGFARVAKCDFALDTDMIAKYYTPIVLNVVKSMDKLRAKGKLGDTYLNDSANYEETAQIVLDTYLANYDARYNLESVASDPRGRAIFKALTRVFNPVSSKDARACLRMPSITVKVSNKDQMNDIFYFIAELTGSKAKSEAGKFLSGRIAYKQRKLPNPDLHTEDGRKCLHEQIWLERIYNKLDELMVAKSISWDIPLEVDASMSIAQFVGALTNESRLLSRTNVIGTELTDPWHIPGVRRLAGKLIGTPVFYGSSQAATALLSAGGLEPLPGELKLIAKEFSTGTFSIMKQFKNALISNYSMHKPEFDVTIWGETFTVPVNKFKPAGSTKIFTTAFDSKSGKYRTAITHEPILIPDYNRFKLYFATLLVHNLDSQVMNNIAMKIPAWMLTIHDAAIAAPGVCKQIREQYAIELQAINTNRQTILDDYRKSIGATSRKANIDFMKLEQNIVPAENVTFNRTAMK